MATTTPNYGWDVPTSTDYVKDGATAIETLGDDIDATLWTALGGAYPGLRLIKKQTIGSAVSTVTVTGAFSATYENYKVIVNGGVGSSNNNLLLTLGSTNTGYYFGSTFTGYAPAGGYTFDAGQNASSIKIATYNTNTLNANFELYNPFTATATSFNSINIDPTTTGRSGMVGGYVNNTTSYTSFTLTPAGGTITGGTIYVYAYGV